LLIGKTLSEPVSTSRRRGLFALMEYLLETADVKPTVDINPITRAEGECPTR
jgi:hypothetical protein